MRAFRSLCAAAALLASLGAASANATVLHSFTGPSSPIPTDGITLLATFNGDAGAAEATFTLDGYDSLDGQNFFEDDFTLTLNGDLILKGTYNLGGGGADVTYLKPLGATVTNLMLGGPGGKVLITTPLNLVAGVNHLAFFYSALPAPDHAGFQGSGDETWGVENLTITQAGGVPEPATWGLMILGMAAAGAALRRRRFATA